MKQIRIIYLCNALDEGTSRERGITSDSPAANKKVLQVARALRHVGVETVVLSLGRGRASGPWSWHGPKIARVEMLLCVYAAYFNFPVVTHLVSLVALLPLVLRLADRRKDTVLLVYNRLPFYLAAVMFARVLGMRLYLDLEDAESQENANPFYKMMSKAVPWVFDQLCNEGATLAGATLRSRYGGTRTLCCYGVATPTSHARDWGATPLLVHFGGTLRESTGAQLFLNCIRFLRREYDGAYSDIEFLVTGKGILAPEIEMLSVETGLPRVQWFGSLTREAYCEKTGGAHVGLSLRISGALYTASTFPSKVLEIGSSGMLLLTTRNSDVPSLFEADGAIYVDDETAEGLAEKLMWVAEHRIEAAAIADRGKRYVCEKCSEDVVGAHLKSFFGVRGMR